MNAKILHGNFNPLETTYIIICAACNGDCWTIESNVDPTKGDDWEVDRMICKKCGAVLFDTDCGDE